MVGYSCLGTGHLLGTLWFRRDSGVKNPPRQTKARPGRAKTGPPVQPVVDLSHVAHAVDGARSRTPSSRGILKPARSPWRSHARAARKNTHPPTPRRLCKAVPFVALTQHGLLSAGGRARHVALPLCCELLVKSAAEARRDPTRLHLPNCEDSLECRKLQLLPLTAHVSPLARDRR